MGTPIVFDAKDVDEVSPDQVIIKGQNNPNLQYPGPTGVYKTQPTPDQALEEDYRKQGPVTRGMVGFNESFGVPKSVSKNPSEAVEGVKLAASHPKLLLNSLAEMYQNATKAQTDLLDRAFQMQDQPGFKNKQHAFALRVYAAIPLIGPNLAAIVDRWTSGDKAGALGQLTGIGAQLNGPAITSKAAEVLPSSIDEVTSLPGKVQQGVQNLKEGAVVSARRNLQNLTGAGPEATSEKMITDYRNKAVDAKAKQVEENASTVKANKDAVVNAYEQAKINERDAKAAEQTKQNKFQTNVQTQAKAASDIKDLQTNLDKASVEHGKHVNALRDNVKAAENEKFNAIRSEIGNPEAPGDGLVQSVKDAQTNILQNIPENVKEFRSILGLEEKPAPSQLENLRGDVMRSQGINPDTVPYEKLDPGPLKELVDKITSAEAAKSGIPMEAPAPEVKPVTWDYLQSIKSRIDAKLRKPGAMNGDLKRALFSVRDGVVDQMGQMAEGAGQGDAWMDARASYRQFKEDFEEPTGPSGSGSPVAQVVNAVDPQNIRRPVIQKQSTIGNRHVDILSRPEYADIGGKEAAQSAQSIVDLNQQLEAAPKPKAVNPPAPGKPVEAVPVKHETPKQVKQPDLPTPEELQQMKANAVGTTGTGWKRLTRFDAIMVGSHLIGLDWNKVLGGLAIEKGAGILLTKRPVIDFISQPLPEEIAAFKSLPKDTQVTVRGKMQEFIKKGKEKGAITYVSPETASLLSGNITTKKPGDQKKDLKKLVSSNPNMP